jgi:hypothetical protein
MVGLGRLELPTSSLSGMRSNHLSYRPCSSKFLSELGGGGEEQRLLRKEVIQPQVPLRLPCYDFTPVTSRTLGSCLLAVGTLTSGTTDSHGVTGGVYKARERIHRGMLIRDY